MKFIDEVNIDVIAGKGGNGIVSFRREAGIPRGGPDGGDGGHGGNIFFVGDYGNNTLLNFRSNSLIKGFNGVNGRRKDMHGANGMNKYVKVPIGTLVINTKNKNIIADIIDDSEYLIAKGGAGGKGNPRFKSSVNSAPRVCENGTKGEELEVLMSLKLLANVGLVGLPSAGKSTILSVISNAKPKIASYDFTTLNPQLGLVKVFDSSIIVADLPGLIESASVGKGLGIQFLKHIERCNVIAHVVDMGSENHDPIESYEIIRNELKNFNPKILEKNEIIIANKNDLPDFKRNYELFTSKYPNLDIIQISSLTDHNFDMLKQKLYSTFQSSTYVSLDNNVDEVTITLDEEIIVNNNIKGFFDVTGKTIERIYEKIPLLSYDNELKFLKSLKNAGLWEILKEKGISDGDTVEIFNYQFRWGEE